MFEQKKSIGTFRFGQWGRISAVLFPEPRFLLVFADFAAFLCDLRGLKLVTAKYAKDSQRAQSKPKRHHRSDSVLLRLDSEILHALLILAQQQKSIALRKPEAEGLRQVLNFPLKGDAFSATPGLPVNPSAKLGAASCGTWSLPCDG